VLLLLWESNSSRIKTVIVVRAERQLLFSSYKSKTNPDRYSPKWEFIFWAAPNAPHFYLFYKLQYP
jgi:hypothetical protein